MRTPYAFQNGGKPISPAQAIKTSKVASISTATLWRQPTFTNSIQSLLSNAWAFEENYEICFVEVRIIDLVKDKTSSNLLAFYSAWPTLSTLQLVKSCSSSKGCALFLWSWRKRFSGKSSWHYVSSSRRPLHYLWGGHPHHSSGCWLVSQGRPRACDFLGSLLL